jgi:MoaA/NifB/PqqE/SkfB family radical SAM enzyme
MRRRPSTCWRSRRARSATSTAHTASSSRRRCFYRGSRFRMADDLLDAYVRQLIEAHAGVPEAQVAWRQGGEPTMMGVEFFRRSIELADRYLQPGQRALYTIQTNGTLLDDEWAAFFSENDFLVGISIDGPRELHDAYRVYKGGKGSFEQVMRGLGHLLAAGVEWNALTTIHAANRDHGRDVYRFLRDDCGARFVQFIPIIERVSEADADGTVPWTSWRDRPLYVQQGDRVTGRSVTATQYGRFLIDVFEGMGAPRRWRRLRPDFRRLPRQLGRRAARAVHSHGDLRARPRARAHGRRLLLRPLRRARLQAREDQGATARRAGRAPAAAAVRARQARHATAVLPRLRRALRLPRWLPQGPLHHHPQRRPRAQLTCARATRTSSTTSTGLCGSWVNCSRRAERRRRSCGYTRPRTPNAAATTPPLAAPAASGSTATATDQLARPPRGPERLTGAELVGFALAIRLGSKGYLGRMGVASRPRPSSSGIRRSSRWSRRSATASWPSAGWAHSSRARNHRPDPDPAQLLARRRDRRRVAVESIEGDQERTGPVARTHDPSSSRGSRSTCRPISLRAAGGQQTYEAASFKHAESLAREPKGRMNRAMP